LIVNAVQANAFQLLTFP